jgi:hypothetical protein
MALSTRCERIWHVRGTFHRIFSVTQRLTEVMEQEQDFSPGKALHRPNKHTLRQCANCNRLMQDDYVYLLDEDGKKAQKEVSLNRAKNWEVLDEAKRGHVEVVVEPHRMRVQPYLYDGKQKKGKRLPHDSNNGDAEEVCGFGSKMYCLFPFFVFCFCFVFSICPFSFFLFLSFFLSSFLPFFLSLLGCMGCLFLFVCLLGLFVCLFVCWLVCLVWCLFLCFFVYLFVWLFVCLVVCLVGCLFICLFICLFDCFVCFICLFVCLLDISLTLRSTTPRRRARPSARRVPRRTPMHVQATAAPT